jgi:hypothetical protein
MEMVNSKLDHEVEMHIWELTKLGINRVLADRLMKMTDGELTNGVKMLASAPAERLAKANNGVTGAAMLAATRREIELRA